MRYSCAATVRVYDDGGKTIDRYTVVLTRSSLNTWECIGMSQDVTSPQGFYQHSVCRLGRHLGKRISFAALPAAHRERIIQELREVQS